MKIIALQAENVKRLTAIEIRPDGNLVQITGKNGQGKTSVMDSIWWALSGLSNIQPAPIRDGAEEARIRLDMGEIIVTRKFTRTELGKFTTSLIATNAEGARFPSPQKMLDSLVSALSFDPLEFTRKDPKSQLEQLKGFVPGVDFDAIERAQKADYEARTDINRRAREARAAADAVVIPLNLPAAAIDESALIEELEGAGEANTELEQRRARRARNKETAKAFRGYADNYLAQIVTLRREIESLEKQAADHIELAMDLEEGLASEEALPAPIDTSEIRAKIDEARRVNKALEGRAQKDRLAAQAREFEDKSKALTAAMEARDAAKRKAIADAELPVPGIEFGDGRILLNGQPFEQASDAEQLRASIAIAMAANPKLRVIRVRDGSLLDEDAMQILSEMADAADVQVWIERVDSTGAVGFVLEDGHLKTPAMAAE